MLAFQFQIVAQTEAEAQQFMTAVQAEDVVIEEWEYNLNTPQEYKEYYGFGLTRQSPAQLKRLADDRGIVLAYVEDQNSVDEKTEELLKRLAQAHNIVAGMNLTSEAEMRSQMFEIYQQLLDHPNDGQQNLERQPESRRANP
jgi:hypothetical protein